MPVRYSSSKTKQQINLLICHDCSFTWEQMLLSSHTPPPPHQTMSKFGWEFADWNKKRFEMHSSSSQKKNIRVSTDMQSTNYTIKNTSKILPLVRPSRCHTSQFKPQYVFWNSWVKSQTILRWFNSVRINVNRWSAIRFSKSSFDQYWTRSVSNNFGNFAISKENDFKKSQSPQSP